MKRTISLLIANIIIGVSFGLMVHWHQFAIAAACAMTILINNFDLTVRKIAGKDKL